MIEQEGLFDPPSFVGFRLSIGGQAGGFTIIRPVRPEVFQKYGFVLGRDQRREGGGSRFMIALFSTAPLFTQCFTLLEEIREILWNL